MNIVKLKTVSSTNTYLKELSENRDLEEGTVVAAEEQTSGKGQRGNSWESEPEKNILCSMLLFPDFLPIKENFLLSEIIALAVKKTLDMHTENIVIKWPNDIYRDEKKIAGILIENELLGSQYSKSIIGIGININQDFFNENVPNAVSLKQITNFEFDLNTLLRELIDNILFWYEKLRQGESDLIENEYRQSLYRKTGFHLYADKTGSFRAKIEKIGRDGFLHLITDEGEKRKYMFKEVNYIM